MCFVHFVVNSDFVEGPMKKFTLLAGAIAIIVPLSLDTVRAAEITLIGPGGIRAAATELIEAFETTTGHKVKATFGSGGGTKQQVINGEPFDVPIVQLPLEPVIASSHVVASSETLVAAWRSASPCAAARPSRTSPAPKR